MPGVEKDKNKLETVKSKTLRHRRAPQCHLQEKHSSHWRTSTFASIYIAFIQCLQFNTHTSTHLIKAPMNRMTALSIDRYKVFLN